MEILLKNTKKIALFAKKTEKKVQSPVAEPRNALFLDVFLTRFLDRFFKFCKKSENLKIECSGEQKKCNLGPKNVHVRFFVQKKA